MAANTRVTHTRPNCDCFGYYHGQIGEVKPSKESLFHNEVQDTAGPAWELLNILIEKAAATNARKFAPGLEMPPDLWANIVELPPSIGELTSVRKLYLYSSHLVRVPPEIGDMTGLEELDLYTSYRLHWLPYEVTQCTNLKRSRFSTRALYGNYKFRPPFPPLITPNIGVKCSICSNAISTASPAPVWISLRVGTDILPLLANVCSEDCIARLPSPAVGYVDHPHRGGLDLVQPPAKWM